LNAENREHGIRGGCAPFAAETEAAKTFAGRISLMDGKYVLVSDTENFPAG